MDSNICPFCGRPYLRPVDPYFKASDEYVVKIGPKETYLVKVKVKEVRRGEPNVVEP